ncbi:Uu.00g065340.m01.CDS01 [Anthostomella pinea]|uniref:Uu.00g065340.m01.CDS01 n=1 Tax=Anthostomella pinea TaxID=933095 RepID=A0AAI8YN25_9PEZI|nr:Uu.00g065340.m01.CDS01 [Anthostomella pinea]
MAFLVFQDPLHGAFFVLVLILMPMSIVATGLRFLATKYSGRKPGLEDWFALLALLFYLITSILTETTLAVINGENELRMAVEDPERFAHFRKMIYANTFFYPIQMLLVKLSIMTLYHRIFGVNQAFARWIYAIGLVHIAWIILAVLLQALECLPVEKFRRPFIPGRCLTGVVGAPIEIVNSLVDFALVILAMFMIQSISITKGMKSKLRALFGLGSIIGIIGFVKIGVSYTPNQFCKELLSPVTIA